MTTSDYQPISCGAYDEIELLAMHRADVTLVIAAGQAEPERQVRGRVIDTSIHNGAEFIVLETGGQRAEFRLDQLRRIRREGD